MNELVLTYVSESEHLTYDEALALAEERDAQAASGFEASVPDSERLLSPDELMALIAREGIRQNVVMSASCGDHYRVKVWDSL